MENPSGLPTSTRARAGPAQRTLSCPVAPWPCPCLVCRPAPSSSTKCLPRRHFGRTAFARPVTGPGLGNRPLIQNGPAHTFPHTRDGWHESDGPPTRRRLGNQKVDQSLHLRRPGQSAFHIVQQVSVQLFPLF